MDFKAHVSLGLICLIFLTACPQEDEEDDNTQPTEVALATFTAENERAQAISLYDVDLAPLVANHQHYAFEQFISFNRETNYVTAPFDQQQTLAMMALGAQGETLQLISDVINIPLTEELSYSAINSWEQHITAQPSIERKIAFWGQSRYTFSVDYLNNQTEWFYPEITALDFLNNHYNATNTIETWFDNELYIPLEAESRIVHGQTSRLNNFWSSDLSLIEPFTGRFLSIDETQPVSLDMVRLTGTINTVAHDQYQAYDIPLADSAFSLLLIAPTAGNFSNIQASIDAEFFQNILSSMQAKEASLAIPTFALNTTPIAPAGLDDAYSEDADFTAVNGRGYLKFGQFKQNIQFNLTESQINSQSATAVISKATEDEPSDLFTPISNGLIITSPPSISGGLFITTPPQQWQQPCYYPPEQRPFIFSLYEKESGTIMYLGQITTLEGVAVESDWSVNSQVSCGDGPPIQIHRYTEAVNCDPLGISRNEMINDLSLAGIERKNTNIAWSPYIDTTISSNECGEPTGGYYSFLISNTDIELAEALSFFTDDRLDIN